MPLPESATSQKKVKVPLLPHLVWPLHTEVQIYLRITAQYNIIISHAKIPKCCSNAQWLIVMYGEELSFEELEKKPVLL